jgi:hypothetical protein
MTGAHGLDPALDVRLGDRRASIALHALAAETGLPVARLRGILLGLLLTSRCHAGAASTCPSSSDPPVLEAAEGGTTGWEVPERPEGPERFPTFPTFPNENEKAPVGTFPTLESRRSDAREGPVAMSDLVAHLARSLGEEASLPVLERLVADHPEALLRRALAVTLRVPAERIRSSRTAYFTGVVRRLLTNSPDSHDRTSPAPP